MQYPYLFGELIPNFVYLDNDGDTHAIYELPAPKGWIFRYYPPGRSQARITKHIVKKIRVCITTMGPVHESLAVVIPFNEEDEEDHSGAMILPGAQSIIGVLERMGFIPKLYAN